MAPVAGATPFTPPAGSTPAAVGQPALLQRLEAWCLDPPGAAWTFSQKLAREQRWSSTYAERVVREYRRFLYLAVTAGHPVCPSDAVDQAWHQHLLETRSYWLEFCPEVLGQPLHHTPSRGGETERRKLADWYSRTLDSYQARFGQPPPADIWPAPERRFAAAPPAQGPKSSNPWRRRLRLRPFPAPLASPLAVAALGVAIGGCQASIAGQPLTQPFTQVLAWSGPQFLLFYGLLIVATGAAVWLLRTWFQATATNRPPEGWQPHVLDLAFLAGGAHRACTTALLNLVQAGEVVLHQGVATLQTTDDGRPRHALEAAIVRELGRQANGSRVSPLISLLEVSDPMLGSLGKGLATKGLVVAPRQRQTAQILERLLLGSVLLLGLVRLVNGLSAGRPVGYLILELILFLVLAIALIGCPLRCTWRGHKLLQKARYQIERRARDEAPKDLATSYALLGIAALPAVLVGELNGSASGGGGADGGSTGGCGGGCGGCGGCGG